MFHFRTAAAASARFVGGPAVRNTTNDTMQHHCANPATATVPFVQQQHPLAASWSSQWQQVKNKIIQNSSSKQISVKRSTTPEFMYAEPGVAGRLEDSGLGCAVELVEMTPEQLFAVTEIQQHDDNSANSSPRPPHPTPPYYYYYTAPLPMFDDRVDALCTGWEGLIVDPDAATHQLATPPYASIWIGGEGSTTQAHYDVSNNILVQLGGKKRVRLWAPSAHELLQVFPDAHPRARKSQVRISSNSDSNKAGGLWRHDDSGSDSGSGLISIPEPFMDVVLAPGDAIYIPAFWFHHCEAVGASASINVFSDSHAKLQAQMMLASKLPQSLPSARHELHPWFRSVSNAMIQSFRSTAVDGPTFLRRLVSSRYGLEGVDPPPLPPSVVAAAEAAAIDVDTVTKAAQVGVGEEVGGEAMMVEEQPDWSKFLLDDFAPPQDGDSTGSIVMHTNQHLTSGNGSDEDKLEDGNMHLLNPTALADALVEADIKQVQSEFASLKRIATGGSTMADDLIGDGVDGVCELVAAHMLELWAVQSVGAADGGQLLAEAAGVDNGTATLEKS